MRLLAALAVLCMASQAAALEAYDGKGLDVAIEDIAEPIEVDGLSFKVRRATGPDVAHLAHRIGERWRAAGSPLRELSRDGWQMLSRWDGNHAELLQWRGTGAAAELLYSRLDARRPAAPAGVAPLQLPARCAWGRQVTGIAGSQRYQQRTALCRGPAATLMPELQALLASAGWQWREASAQVLQVARGGTEGMLVLVPGRSAAECWLTWVASRPAGGAQR